jgi:hypothetical protein
MNEKKQRLVEWTPAFDKRDPNPSKNYGIHGMNLRFVLKGERGAIQFLIFTGWHLPRVQEEFKRKGWDSSPMPADLGYHSLAPHYEGQGVQSDSCEYCDGKPCYYDGSGLNAEPVFDKFVSEGEEAMWAELASYYELVFGGAERRVGAAVGPVDHSPASDATEGQTETSSSVRPE